MRIVAATSNAGSATRDQGGYCEQRRKMGKGTGKGTGPLDESFKLMAMGTVRLLAPRRVLRPFRRPSWLAQHISRSRLVLLLTFPPAPQYAGYIAFGLIATIIGAVYYANIGSSSGFVAVRKPSQPPPAAFSLWFIGPLVSVSRPMTDRMFSDNTLNRLRL